MNKKNFWSWFLLIGGGIGIIEFIVWSAAFSFGSKALFVMIVLWAIISFSLSLFAAKK